MHEGRLGRGRSPLTGPLRLGRVLQVLEDKFFLSNDEHYGAGGALVLEKEVGFLRVGGEVGYEWLQGRNEISQIRFVEDGEDERKLLTIDDKLHMRAGVATELFVDDLWLVGEVNHWARATHLYNTEREAPVELGAALRFERSVLVLLGASTGVTDAVGAPSVRVFASLGHAF